VTKIILVRHGETAWTLVNRIQGWLDIPLNGMGRKQAGTIAKELTRKKIDAIYSSRLSRAYDTAKLIARPHSLRIKKEINLNELNQGKWQGSLVKEVEKMPDGLYQQWQGEPLSFRPPGGESILEVYERVIHVLEDISRKYPDGRVVIVGHKVVNAVVKCYCRKVNLSQIWSMLSKAGSWEEMEVPK
jgi:broad specificity phosphatase PhoE